MLLQLFWSANFPKDAENPVLAQPFWRGRPQEKRNILAGSSEVIFHGQLSAPRTLYTEDQIWFLTVEAPLLVISYNVLSSSWVPCPCPMPFTDLIYTFLFMFFNKIWPEVFQQKIGYIFLLPVNEQRVCQEIVLIFQQSEEKQVSCQLLFLLAIHPWNTADSSICYPWEFQREIALTRQSSPELTPQNSDVQVTWEVLWILLRKFVIW